MLFGKKKRHVSLDYNDFGLQVLTYSSADLSQAKAYSIPLDEGIVVEGIIEDELAFFELLKEQVKNWGIKGQNVRFFVPESTVMMKSIDHPKELVDKKAIKEYVEMELGRAIHLPFENPLIDIYDAKQGDGKATIFATNAEEVQKVVSILMDAGLTPAVADIKVISLIRFVDRILPNLADTTSLIVNWSINEISLAIYSFGEVEFLRFQMIETERSKWQSRYTEDGFEYVYQDDISHYQMALMDSIAEIERIINFYRFSLNKGEKGVEQIVVMGDSPELSYIAKTIEGQGAIPVHIFTDQMIADAFPNFKSSQASLISLALKEDVKA
ncbi:type IV pilus biogenesis protein PilM [Rummeliibacillus suwonensis]|uniref:type IV pilus biogenesis protein PilM n=1 Tax=Rummeliibacillus suwonensis TaxID=1306154 RepID=UPI0011B744A6|nr:pilus assembly protein PilM [Rummeliibacillus suwonensis]